MMELSKLIVEATYSENESPVFMVIPVRKINRHPRQQTENGTFQNDDGLLLSSSSVHQGMDPIVAVFTFRADAASCFLSELLRSKAYRRLVWHSLTSSDPSRGSSQHKAITLRILLDPVHRYPLDYRFGHQVQLLVNEKIELDNFMSCLSTLGGAFSSLGDQFVHCAMTAGRISAQQYKIAEKLGDPVTLMRCQLYLSISLIQLGRLRQARYIISTIYRQIKSTPEALQDKRVLAMCQGIWSKLRYTWQLDRQNIRCIK